MKTVVVFVFVLFFLFLVEGVVRIPLEKKLGSIRTRNNYTSTEKGVHQDLFGNLAETHIYYTSVQIGGEYFSVIVGK